MTRKDILKLMLDGFHIEVKDATTKAGPTQYRTLVRGREQRKGISQPTFAAMSSADLIECSDYKRKPQQWWLSSMGMVVAEKEAS